MVQRTEILHAGPAMSSPPWPPWSILGVFRWFSARLGVVFSGPGAPAWCAWYLVWGGFCGGREGCVPKERMARQEGNMGRCR